MEPDREDHIRPKASITKTLLFMLLALFLIIITVMIFARVAYDGPMETMPQTPSSDSDQTRSPDKVKVESGMTGDTVPSSGGTGDGNANTLQNPR